MASAGSSRDRSPESVGRLRAASGFWAAIAGATDLVRLTRPSIASGDERLIPTFWEVAARSGFRTAVVHWWATWPASDDSGIVLSDRAILRLEHGGPNDAEIAPAPLYDTLRSRLDRAPESRGRGRGWTRRGHADLVSSTLRRSAELDATILDLAADPALGTPDLLVVYLPGLDIAQHTLLGSPDAAGLAPSVVTTRVASLERYYQFLDERAWPAAGGRRWEGPPRGAGHPTGPNHGAGRRIARAQR